MRNKFLLIGILTLFNITGFDILAMKGRAITVRFIEDNYLKPYQRSRDDKSRKALIDIYDKFKAQNQSPVKVKLLDDSIKNLTGKTIDQIKAQELAQSAPPKNYDKDVLKLFNEVKSNVDQVIKEIESFKKSNKSKSPEAILAEYDKIPKPKLDQFLNAPNKLNDLENYINNLSDKDLSKSTRNKVNQYVSSAISQISAFADYLQGLQLEQGNKAGHEATPPPLPPRNEETVAVELFNEIKNDVANIINDIRNNGLGKLGIPDDLSLVDKKLSDVKQFLVNIGGRSNDVNNKLIALKDYIKTLYTSDIIKNISKEVENYNLAKAVENKVGDAIPQLVEYMQKLEAKKAELAGQGTGATPPPPPPPLPSSAKSKDAEVSKRFKEIKEYINDIVDYVKKYVDLLLPLLPKTIDAFDKEINSFDSGGETLAKMIATGQNSLETLKNYIKNISNKDLNQNIRDDINNYNIKAEVEKRVGQDLSKIESYLNQLKKERTKLINSQKEKETEGHGQEQGQEGQGTGATPPPPPPPLPSSAKSKDAEVSKRFDEIQNAVDQIINNITKKSELVKDKIPDNIKDVTNDLNTINSVYVDILNQIDALKDSLQDLKNYIFKISDSILSKNIKDNVNDYDVEKAINNKAGQAIFKVNTYFNGLKAKKAELEKSQKEKQGQEQVQEGQGTANPPTPTPALPTTETQQSEEELIVKRFNFIKKSVDGIVNSINGFYKNIVQMPDDLEKINRAIKGTTEFEKTIKQTIEKNEGMLKDLKDYISGVSYKDLSQEIRDEINNYDFMNKIKDGAGVSMKHLYDYLDDLKAKKVELEKLPKEKTKEKEQGQETVANLPSPTPPIAQPTTTSSKEKEQEGKGKEKVKEEEVPVGNLSIAIDSKVGSVSVSLKDGSKHAFKANLKSDKSLEQENYNAALFLNGLSEADFNEFKKGIEKELEDIKDVSDDDIVSVWEAFQDAYAYSLQHDLNILETRLVNIAQMLFDLLTDDGKKSVNGAIIKAAATLD